MSDSTVQVSAQVEPELKERVEARALVEERPVGTIVRRALETYLSLEYSETLTPKTNTPGGGHGSAMGTED